MSACLYNNTDQEECLEAFDVPIRRRGAPGSITASMAAQRGSSSTLLDSGAAGTGNSRRVDAFINAKINSAKAEIDRLRTAVMRSPRQGAAAAASGASSPSSQGDDAGSHGACDGDITQQQQQQQQQQQHEIEPRQHNRWIAVLRSPRQAATDSAAAPDPAATFAPKENAAAVPQAVAAAAAGPSAATSGASAADTPAAVCAERAASMSVLTEVAEQLAAARLALAERDAEVSALHNQVQRLSNYVDSIMSGDRTAECNTLGMRDLQAQLLRSGVEAGSLLEQLSEAQVNISEARHAASDHQSTMALLSRQVAALRVVLDEKISESEAKSEAAARKERDLVAEYEGERGRAESEAARVLRAEFEAEVLRGELEAARRELTRFTGSDSEKCEAAAGAAREAALKEALAAAEMTGEELARILLDREEELTYYKRHCGALQQQLLQAKRRPSEPSNRTSISTCEPQADPATDHPVAAAASTAAASANAAAAAGVADGAAAKVLLVVGEEAAAAAAAPGGMVLGPIGQKVAALRDRYNAGVGKEQQEQICKLKEELKDKERALKEATVALNRAEAQIHGLQTVQAAKTAQANRLEAEMCQMEAQLRTKTTEVKRLAEALDASEASAAAARSAAGVALKQESTAMGELAAARLQVAALLEGLTHDLKKASKADPQGYAQLRSEAQQLLQLLPSPEQQQRYAALYNAALAPPPPPGAAPTMTRSKSYTSLAGGDQQQRQGSCGSGSASSSGSGGRTRRVTVSGVMEQQQAALAPAAAQVQLGDWLLQAAGIRRRSSCSSGTSRDHSFNGKVHFAGIPESGEAGEAGGADNAAPCCPVPSKHECGSRRGSFVHRQSASFGGTGDEGLGTGGLMQALARKSSMQIM